MPLSMRKYIKATSFAIVIDYELVKNWQNITTCHYTTPERIMLVVSFHIVMD